MKMNKLKEVLAFCGAIFSLIFAPLFMGALLLEYLHPQTILEHVGALFLTFVLITFLMLCTWEWVFYIEERTENITKKGLLRKNEV